MYNTLSNDYTILCVFNCFIIALGTLNVLKLFVPRIPLVLIFIRLRQNYYTNLAFRNRYLTGSLRDIPFIVPLVPILKCSGLFFRHGCITAIGISIFYYTYN